MSSSVGEIMAEGEVVGYVRCYETPVPPVVHGLRVYATTDDLAAHWSESDWTLKCPHGGAHDVKGEIAGECYGEGEWPVTVCRECRIVVDGFQPVERDDGGWD